MANKGWITIYRQILESDIWVCNQPFDYRSAWIDLLLMANHEDRIIIFDYEPMTISRGQFVTSVRKLGERWKWGKERTLKYLRLLEKLGMITKDSNARRTLITIENYGKYQDIKDTDEDSSKDSGEDTPRTPPEHCPSTNNNVNNDNNDNKDIYIPKTIYPSSFDEFWSNYPRKQDKGQAYRCYQARLNDGYTEEQLLTACKNYAEECEREKREKKYIKVGSTFLSVNEPFVDYLEKGGASSESERRTNGHTEQHTITYEEARELYEYANSEEAERENAEFWGEYARHSV